MSIGNVSGIGIFRPVWLACLRNINDNLDKGLYM